MRNPNEFRLRSVLNFKRYKEFHLRAAYNFGGGGGWVQILHRTIKILGSNPNYTGTTNSYPCFPGGEGVKSIQLRLKSGIVLRWGVGFGGLGRGLGVGFSGLSALSRPSFGGLGFRAWVWAECAVDRSNPAIKTAPASLHPHISARTQA